MTPARRHGEPIACGREGRTGSILRHSTSIKKPWVRLHYFRVCAWWLTIRFLYAGM